MSRPPTPGGIPAHRDGVKAEDTKHLEQIEEENRRLKKAGRTLPYRVIVLSFQVGPI